MIFPITTVATVLLCSERNEYINLQTAFKGVWCVLCLLHTCKKKFIWFSTYLAWFYWKGSSLHLWSDWDKSFGMTGTFYWSESFTLPVIEVTLITKAIELRRYFFPIRKLVIMIKKIVLTQNKGDLSRKIKLFKNNIHVSKGVDTKDADIKVALMFQQHRKLGAMNDRFAWN